MTQAPVWAIATLAIAAEGDVVAVRQHARHIAELLGFERQDQTRIATAVSEVARNALSHAGGGRVEFMVEPAPTPQIFRIRIGDNGRGITDLQSVLDGAQRANGGAGFGLVGARRLMDQFSIRTEPGRGTVVELGHVFPRRRPRVTQADVGGITTAISGAQPEDPLAALRDQNRDLIQSLAEIRNLREESGQLSQELSDTNRGVVALYAELDERAEQLRQASELKSRFLSHMSHELRTPLNSILALSRLLLDRVDGDLATEQERQVTLISRSAESLLELVNDLLDLAKVEAGKVEVKPAPFSVPELFGALRGALRPLRTSASVELIFEVAADMPELVTDEAKVAQILRNFISNALKFTEQGEVRVSARHEAGHGLAIFSVEDTGIGIRPEDQARIFDEFAQIDTGLQRRTKGTGLGLPLSRSLAGLLGGAIRVDSEFGKGSVFTLTIPEVIGQAAAPQAPAQEGPRKRVLVIDDDATFRYVIRQIIAHEPRYEVIEASDGSDGLRRTREDRPDVILLDLQMPKMDGFKVLEELMADARTRLIPVIVTTSLSVNAELRARLPPGTRLISKDLISRDNLSMFLRDVLSWPSLP